MRGLEKGDIRKLRREERFWFELEDRYGPSALMETVRRLLERERQTAQQFLDGYLAIMRVQQPTEWEPLNEPEVLLDVDFDAMRFRDAS